MSSNNKKIIFEFVEILAIVFGIVFFSSLVWSQDLAETGPVKIAKEGENQAIRLIVESYSIQKEKLGDPAPEGSLFLIIRGTLINKNTVKGASVPPVEKAFYLRLAENNNIYMDPISEDTADPFWGEMILQPGEEFPFEAVFAVPVKPIPEASFMHLSNKGPIKIYIIGEGPALPATYLSEAKHVGDARIAVEKISSENSYNGKTAPAGWEYLYVNYWFTNMREAQPLETYLAELMILEEDGRYVYSPDAEKRTEENPIQETFYAKEPTEATIAFLVPKERGDLTLVHFTDAGPLRLDLTPDVDSPVVSAPVAGPAGSNAIKISLYTDNSGYLEGSSDTLILDVGLQLNHKDPAASFNFKPMTSFELHDNQGRVLKPIEVGSLKRPYRQTDLFRDQVARGDVAFKVPNNSSDLQLVIPFASGPTKLPVPASLLVKRPNDIKIARGVVEKKKDVASAPQPAAQTEDKPKNMLDGGLFSALNMGGGGSSNQEKPEPAVREKPEIKKEAKIKNVPMDAKPTKASAAEEIAGRGFSNIFLIEKGEGTAVVIGSVNSGEDIETLKSIVASYPEIKEVKMHVSSESAEAIHPRTLRIQTQEALKAVGLKDVQVRSRKKDELILIGNVANDDEEQMAVSIAKVQPGVVSVVNNLKRN